MRSNAIKLRWNGCIKGATDYDGGNNRTLGQCRTESVAGMKENRNTFNMQNSKQTRKRRLR